jgi:MFS transporter, DHA1 family, inner membrane transport protein
MAYLKNSAVNLLNLHYGLHALALNGAGVFFAVFLLKAGVSVPAVFAAIGLVIAVRFLTRPLILVLAPRTGLRALVVFGTIFTGVQYLFLAEVRGVDVMLLGFCISAAIGDTFYWTSYHAYFAALGDSEHRGHQIGAREALGSVAAIVGPLIGGWALTTLGPRVAFGAAAVVHVLAALPFLGTPEVRVGRNVPRAFRAAVSGIMLFAADGWIAVGYYFVWQIALFVSLGESFTAFGGALALAGLVGAIGGLILGKHIDAGHGGRAVWLTFASLAAVTLFRAASTGIVALAVIANAVGALVVCLYTPTLMTAVYNQAKRSPCTLRFHLATEGGWDIGGASGCIVAALLSRAGAPLPVGILLSLAGMVLSLILLRRHYRTVVMPELPLTQPAGGA